MSMAYSTRASLLIAALLVFGLASPARSEPAAEPAKAAPDAIAPAAPARPKRERAISGELAASLADTMPKYAPPPKPVAPVAEEDKPDLREIDKPRNTIIRLPKYVVQAPRPPIFRERDLRTPGGIADLAMKRYAGLGFGPFSELNRGIALTMYQEQERLNNMAGLADDARTLRGAGDSAAADYISRESQKTYLRPDDFGWHGSTSK